MSNDLSVQKGQRARIDWITLSHGKTQAALTEKFGATPKIKQGAHQQVSSVLPGVVTNIHEGATFDWENMPQNRYQLPNVLMDRPPAQTAGTHIDQTRFRHFSAIVHKMEDVRDVANGSQFVYRMLAKGLSEENPAGDITKWKISGEAFRLFDIQGLDLRYIRVTSGTASIAIPTNPTTIAQEAGTTAFKAGDVVHLRVAGSTASHSPGDAAPLISEPLTPAGPIFGVQIAVNGNNISLEYSAFPTGVISVAVYAGRKNGEETFAGWITGTGEGGELDLGGFPDPSAPRPFIDDNSGVFAATGDVQVSSITEGGVTYTNAVDVSAIGTLIPPVLDVIGTRGWVLKNGVLQPDLLDTSTPWEFSPSGKTWFLNAALGTSDVYELIVPQVISS